MPLRLAVLLAVALCVCGWNARADSAGCLPAPGPTGWWPGDLTTNDVAGGRHAILRGGAGYGAGMVREAFALNGNSQFVEVPSAPGLNVGTNNFTFEVWVRFNTLAGEQVIAEKYIETFSTARTGWTLTKMVDNTLRWAVAGGGDVDSFPASTVVPGTNLWTHVAVRRDGINFTIFQNGVATASGVFARNLDTTASLKFGHRGNPSDTPGSTDTRDFWLNGSIDEPTLYVNRVLTDQEIAAIYAVGAAGKCRGPLILAVTPPAGGSVQTTVRGIPGLPHALESSTNFGSWTSISTNVPSVEVFPLTDPSATGPQKFYRAREIH